MTRAWSTRTTTIVLVVGSVALVLVRLVLATGRTGPIVIADEIGYLVNARVLSGGPPALMDRTAVYAGGYSLALLPALLVGQGVESTYNLVLGTNALLGAATFPLLFAVLRRGLGLPVLASVCCGVVGSLYPPFVGYSQVALSENLIVPLLLAWLWCLVELARGAASPRTRMAAAVGGGLAAGWLYATHDRLLPVLAIHLVALAALAVRRHVRPLPLLVGAAVMASSTVAAHLLNRWLSATNWPGRVSDQQSQALSNLLGLDRIAPRAQFVNGEIAYVALAGFGLTVVGAVALVVTAFAQAGGSPWRERLRAAWSAGTRDGLGPAGLPAFTAAVLLLLVLGLLVVTGFGIGLPIIRADHHIYGRYLEIIAPPLLAVGLAALCGWLPTGLRPYALGGVAGGVIGVSVATTTSTAGQVFASPDIAWANVMGLLLPGGTVILQPDRAAVAVIGLLAVLVVVATVLRPGWQLLTVVGTVALLLWSTVVIERAYFQPRQTVYYSTDVTIDDLPEVADADHVAYDIAVPGEAEAFYQYFLDHTTITFFDSEAQEPAVGTDVVISDDDWPGAGADGVHEIWRDPTYGLVLYGVPG